MVEHSGDYEWHAEGEEAEVVLYAPDERTAGSAFERVLLTSRLPGVESPVYAAASPEGLGCIAASTSHVAPDLASVPARGLLLVADAALRNLGAQPEELMPLVSRRLSEVRLPLLAGAGARRICETGAIGAAEDGLIEEEDLSLFGFLAGDADALGRRAISAGTRDWDRPGNVRAYEIGEILNAGGAESLGLEPGTLALLVSAEAGDLGRLALAGHRERIAARGGDFETEEDLLAAPAGTEEAADLLAALGAAANFADGRAALLIYALRRAIGDVVGPLSPQTAWRIGGIEDRDGSLAHRKRLAAAEEGEVLVSGGDVVAGTGKMDGSVPPFGVPEDDGRHPWEEAGVLERWADLGPTEGRA